MKGTSLPPSAAVLHLLEWLVMERPQLLCRGVAAANLALISKLANADSLERCVFVRVFMNARLFYYARYHPEGSEAKGRFSGGRPQQEAEDLSAFGVL
jgi:hypothetical protein